MLERAPDTVDAKVTLLGTVPSDDGKLLAYAAPVHRRRTIAIANREMVTAMAGGSAFIHLGRLWARPVQVGDVMESTGPS